MKHLLNTQHCAKPLLNICCAQCICHVCWASNCIEYVCLDWRPAFSQKFHFAPFSPLKMEYPSEFVWKFWVMSASFWFFWQWSRDVGISPGKWQELYGVVEETLDYKVLSLDRRTYWWKVYAFIGMLHYPVCYCSVQIPTNSGKWLNYTGSQFSYLWNEYITQGYWEILSYVIYVK